MATDHLRSLYFSREEAAETLDISPRTLDRWWSLRINASKLA